MPKPTPEGNFWRALWYAVLWSLVIWVILACLVLLGIRLAETV